MAFIYCEECADYRNLNKTESKVPGRCAFCVTATQVYVMPDVLATLRPADACSWDEVVYKCEASLLDIISRFCQHLRDDGVAESFLLQTKRTPDRVSLSVTLSLPDPTTKDLN